MLSKFIFSRASGIIALVAMPVILGGAWYIVHTIKQNERLSIALEQANANISEANRRAAAELARSAHKSKLDQQIRDDEKPSNCPDPAIINRAIKRLR